MTDMAMMLLPQPLSPTSPRVLFRFSVRLIPSSARTVLFSRKKYVFRFLISRIGLGLFIGVWLMGWAFASTGKKSKRLVGQLRRITWRSVFSSVVGKTGLTR